MAYRIAVAGSTNYTVQMAQALANDQRFKLVWTLSPVPKPIGRKQTLSHNPLHHWSNQQQIPAFLVQDKINQELRQQLAAAAPIDFLLVVDFGYFVPEWLLALPEIAPLNIHPSHLPSWRGSSPGQFALLHYGLTPTSQTSAISLMIMNQKLDQGPLLSQELVVIQDHWTAADYYNHCFDIMSKFLAQRIAAFAAHQQSPKAQPLLSPTIVAKKLTKADAFISWTELKTILLTKPNDTTATTSSNESSLLSQLLNDQRLCPTNKQQQLLLANASHAFWPWPGLWTIVATSKGDRRMKILPFRGSELELVQIEGKTPCPWRECRNSVKN